MSKTIDNIKSGNYEVVDNQGVSVTRHFTQCLEKEFADLEAKLAEKDRVCDKLQRDIECLEENYAQLESDYEKANELGLEPSYVKKVIKENDKLKAENLSLLEQSIRDNQNYNEELANLQQQLKDNTKQVCEKIREFAYDTFKEFGCFDETDLEHILDQIENENV